MLGDPSDASLLFVASSETDAPFCAEAGNGMMVTKAERTKAPQKRL
jgi:hypothetical protein